ncbi:hypothetical protein [Streptosporangium sp. NPDC006930]|uniref:DUF7927 domain-containing protein n=1 Tax=unclassified Streptosporangium TaxID=2632669 RepID=UPI003423531D
MFVAGRRAPASVVGRRASASVAGRRDARGAFGGESRTAGAGEPEVRITKTASPVLAKPGQKVTYTVEVHNTGDIAHPGLTFTDDLSGLLDDASFDHDQSATSGTVSFAEPRVAWTGDVAAGQTVTVTYGVTVNDPPAGDLRLSGELVGPEGSNCEAGSADRACGNLGGIGLPLLYVLMTAGSEAADPGQTVAYTITVGNVGNATYPGATLTGELSRILDDAVYNGDARATSGTVSYGAPKLNWAGDIRVGETVTVTYSVTVGTPATGDGVLDSAVQALGGGTNCPDPVPWSARRAAPVPGTGLGCAQRVAVRRTTGTGTLGPEDREVGSAPVPAPGSVPAPESDSGPVPLSGADSAPVPVPESDSASASVPGADSASVPVPESDSVPGSVSAPVPVPGREPEPAPARVPEPVSDPSCMPGRGRSFSVPCLAGGPREVSAGPSLPFTGLPLGPALVGLLLSGLGLALRLRTRPGRT